MSDDEDKESPKEEDKPSTDTDVPPCEPCETVHSISVLCEDLGRDSGGYMACRVLTQDVANGKLDPEQYYRKLIERYGRERVEKAAMHAFLDADVSGSEKKEEPIVAERKEEIVPEPVEAKPKEEPAPVRDAEEEKKEVIEDVDEAFKSLSAEDKDRFMKMLREGK